MTMTENRDRITPAAPLSAFYDADRRTTDGEVRFLASQTLVPRMTPLHDGVTKGSSAAENTQEGGK